MAKNTLSFVCQNCGAAFNRWQGKCESCGEWNTLAEEDTTGATSMPVSIRAKRRGRLFQLETLTGKSQEAPRLSSGMAELDRVTGGGFVRGSVLLVGGDPGIGKSTLLTQATSLMARAGHRVVYISGEEAVAQVRLRAERLGLADAPVQLAAETSVEDIVSTLSEGTVPRLIVINSIQTMWTDTVESAPGTVTQVRASAQALIRFAKKSGATIILVGHVTKDGQIAGPRVVEHMVDAVLSFEGEGSQQFRILARGEEPLRADRRDRRVRDDRASACAKSPIRPSCSCPSAISAVRARRCSQASRAPARCWWNCRRWWRRPRWARRGGPWWAGIRAGCRWCWRCWRPIAASNCPATTSI